jgi:hypothetical protein
VVLVEFKIFLVCVFFLLNYQVTKVARMLAAKPKGAAENAQKECGIMALLDGGMLTRQKSWLKVLIN